MNSFTIVNFFALISAAMAFVPLNNVAKVANAVDFKAVGAAVIPAATVASPAFALDSIVEALPTNTLALEVQFGAYLAVLLGTFLPVLFLINLYIQTESRKAGKAGGQDSE